MVNDRPGTDTAHWVTLLRNPHYDFTMAERERMSVALEAARQAHDNALVHYQELEAELAGLREERDALAQAIHEERRWATGTAEHNDARSHMYELAEPLREELRELQEGRETEFGGNRVARSGGERDV